MRPCVTFSGIKVKIFDSSTLVYICLHSSSDSSVFLEYILKSYLIPLVSIPKVTYLQLRKEVFPEEPLKAMSNIFLLFCCLSLKDYNFETKKNIFYFTSEALLVIEIFKF